jgi:hypothetical protein
MERRAFLVGSAFAVAGMASGPVSAQYFDNAWVTSPPQQPLSPADIESAVARLRKQYLAEFDPAYVEHVIVAKEVQGGDNDITMRFLDKASPIRCKKEADRG